MSGGRWGRSKLDSLIVGPTLQMCTGWLGQWFGFYLSRSDKVCKDEGRKG